MSAKKKKEQNITNWIKTNGKWQEIVEKTLNKDNDSFDQCFEEWYDTVLKDQIQENDINSTIGNSYNQSLRKVSENSSSSKGCVTYRFCHA